MQVWRPQSLDRYLCYQLLTFRGALAPPTTTKESLWLTLGVLVPLLKHNWGFQGSQKQAGPVTYVNNFTMHVW